MRLSEWLSVAGLCVLVALGGCDKSADKKTSGKAAEKAVPAQEVCDYKSLGMPDWDRPWSGAEMTKAAEVIELLEVGKLPRSKSKSSGQVFGRLVSHENIAWIKMSSIQTNEVLLDSIKYHGALNRIMNPYIKELKVKGKNTTEMIALVGHALQMTELRWALTEKSNAEFVEKGQSLTSTVRESLIEMKRGNLMVVIGSIHLLSEPADSRADLNLLLAAMKEELPHLIICFDSTERVQILDALEEASKTRKNEDIQTSLRDVISLTRRRE